MDHINKGSIKNDANIFLFVVFLNIDRVIKIIISKGTQFIANRNNIVTIESDSQLSKDIPEITIKKKAQ